MAINLTPKQENFCQSYIENGNASDAYRKAYDAEKMKGATINRNAKALLDNNKIATRIDELRQQHTDRHNLTVDDLIDELDEARNVAIKAENPQCTAAIAATMGKAKLLGKDKHKPGKFEIKDENLTSIAKSVLIAIANGIIPAEHGKLLLDSIMIYAKIQDFTDIADRLDKIESLLT